MKWNELRTAVEPLMKREDELNELAKLGTAENAAMPSARELAHVLSSGFAELDAEAEALTGGGKKRRAPKTNGAEKKERKAKRTGLPIAGTIATDIE